MLTRKMAEAIEKRIDELTTLLENQRMQINSLQSRQPRDVQQNANRFDKFFIPDPIKLIPNYSGEPESLTSWIESVDQKLEYCKQIVNDTNVINEVMPLWTGIIRDKIIKDGSDVLTRNQTPLEWGAIKNALKDELGDKRDLATLSSKISQLKQGSQDLTVFYQECKKLLADINAKLLINDETRSCAKILMKNYESMVTNSFIDGLIDSLSTLTRISRPKNLHEAYQCALELHNANQRKREKLMNKNPPLIVRPQTQPRPYFQQNNNNNAPRPNFPQPPFRQQFYNPTFRPQPNFHQFRQMNSNTNHQPLAIKQEPSSHQTRVQQRPVHNVNSHESLQTPAEFSQYDESHYQHLGYEQEVSITEQKNDPVVQNDSNETLEEVNFCMALDQQMKE